MSFACECLVFTISVQARVQACTRDYSDAARPGSRCDLVVGMAGSEFGTRAKGFWKTVSYVDSQNDTIESTIKVNVYADLADKCLPSVFWELRRIFPCLKLANKEGDYKIIKNLFDNQNLQAKLSSFNLSLQEHFHPPVKGAASFGFAVENCAEEYECSTSFLFVLLGVQASHRMKLYNSAAKDLFPALLALAFHDLDKLYGCLHKALPAHSANLCQLCNVGGVPRKCEHVVATENALRGLPADAPHKFGGGLFLSLYVAGDHCPAARDWFEENARSVSLELESQGFPHFKNDYVEHGDELGLLTPNGKRRRIDGGAKFELSKSVKTGGRAPTTAAYLRAHPRLWGNANSGARHIDERFVCIYWSSAFLESAPSKVYGFCYDAIRCGMPAVELLVILASIPKRRLSFWCAPAVPRP